MECRILKEDEIWQSNLVQAVSFERPFDEKEEKNKTYDIIKVNKDRNKVLPSDNFEERTYWGVFCEDKMASTLFVNNYTVNFDGHCVLMGGIGGVATLPQYRKNGCVRNCFNFLLQDLYNKGFVFSTLYPFSQAYYRKFGYECGAFSKEITISMDAIPDISYKGSVTQLMPGDSTEPLTQIYNEFYKDYNMSVIRKAFEKDMDLYQMLKDRRYVYIYRDADNQPKGFFIGKRNEGSLLNCTPDFTYNNGFIALSAQAYAAMLSFIKSSFASRFNNVKIIVPQNINLDYLFFENNKISYHLDYNAMTRVVNVKKALELCKCKGNGEINISVKDNQIAENNAVWKITFAENMQNKVIKTHQKADICMPINSFTNLLYGAAGSDDIKMMPEVNVINENIDYSQIFYYKKCALVDLF